MPAPMGTAFLFLLLGVALGAALGWLLRSLRAPAASPALEQELRDQLRTRDTALADLRSRLDERARELTTALTESGSRATALAAAERREADAGRLAEERRQAVAAAETEARSAREKALGLEQQLKHLGELMEKERRLVGELQARFQKEFETVSLRLLSENAAAFKAQSTDSLTQLLQPLKENLHEVKAGLESTRRETQTHSALLKDQLQRIGTEAANLSRALKGDVKALGNWGENMLDQILAKSGLQEGLHYRRQHAGTDDGGQARFLDVVVDLPEGRHLIIDSKVSLKHYEEAVNAADEAVRAEQLRLLVQSLRRHVEGLGAKRYHELRGVNTPDFVLMYVPVEPAFITAVGAEPGLIGEALAENVVLITNSSLLATLRTVAHVWRLAEQQKNAAAIAERGGRLYDKFVGFAQDLEAVGAALGAAQRSFEGARSKLSQGPGNLVRQTEMLRELGARSDKALPPALAEAAADGTAASPTLPAGAEGRP